MYAEDMHSATGYSERSSAMSLAADRIEQIESAIDAEMVATHLGVFGEQDDPKKALNSLMVWSESVGGYFAKEKIKELEQERDLHKNSALDYLSLWNASVIERDSLAAQNEALRSALEEVGVSLAVVSKVYWDIFHHSTQEQIEKSFTLLSDALNLPNLATEFLKRRDAATLRRAADAFMNGSLSVSEILREMAAEIVKETK